jgi:hypothetical protein
MQQSTGMRLNFWINGWFHSNGKRIQTDPLIIEGNMVEVDKI